MPASMGEMVMTQQAARRLALHLQPVPLEERAEGNAGSRLAVGSLDCAR
jgi:hypothetical protein